MATRELMRIDGGALVVSVTTDDVTGEVLSVSTESSARISRKYRVIITDPRDKASFSTSEITSSQSQSITDAAMQARRMRCFTAHEAMQQTKEALRAAVTIEVIG
jgi:hypothetical protein